MYPFLRSVSVGRCTAIFLLLWGSATFLVVIHLDQNIYTQHYGPRALDHDGVHASVKPNMVSLHRKMTTTLAKIKEEVEDLVFGKKARSDNQLEEIKSKEKLMELVKLRAAKEAELPVKQESVGDKPLDKELVNLLPVNTQPVNSQPANNRPENNPVVERAGHVNDKDDVKFEIKDVKEEQKNMENDMESRYSSF